MSPIQGPGSRLSRALCFALVLFVGAACGDDQPDPDPDAGAGLDANVSRDAEADAGRDATAADAGDAATPGDAGGDAGGGGDAGTGLLDSSVSATVGPSGGEVGIEGAWVEIPAGALSEAREIRVARESPQVNLPSGYEVRSPIYSFTPHGLSFSSSVTISFRYASGTTADAVLRLADLNDTSWEPVSGPSFANDIASFQTLSFSYYVAAQFLVASGNVFPLYTNATNFNDYVQNDGPDAFRATGTACDPNVGSDPQTTNRECLHAGELRMVTLSGYPDCAGLSAVDALGAFEWTCEVLGGNATMVSTGFKPGAGLSTLIDFTTGTWRGNSVSVSDPQRVILTTPSELWWGNPIVIDNDGMTSSTPGTIYLVTQDSAAFYRLNSDGSALVIQPGFRLTGPHVGPFNGRIELGSAFGLYFEGTVTGSGERGLAITGGHHYLRNIEVSGFNSPIGPARRSRIEDAKFTCVASSANPSVVLANGNILRRIKVANCVNSFSVNGTYNVIEDLFSSGGRISVGGPDQIMAGLTAHHSPENGIEVVSQANLLMHVTTIHNLGYGFLANITAGTRPHRVIGLLTTENRVGGIYLDDRAVLRNAGSWANTHVGINFNPFGGGNVFEGAFTTGLNGDQPGAYYPLDPAGCFNPGIPAIGDCYGSRATTASGNPNGLLSLPNGQCDYDTNSNVTSPFNPPIRGPGYPLAERVRGGGFGDTVNPNDGPDGNSAFANVTNWVDFENFYRGWGSEGSATPSCESQGPCSAASTGPAGCQIYDYRLRFGADTFIARTPDYPDGNAVLTHVFTLANPGTRGQTECERFFTNAVYDGAAQTCTATFLQSAREILGDMRGNENLLCESNEVCLFTPNFASYQGEGPLVAPAGFVFVDGVISNVTLLAHETNGSSMPYSP